LVERYLVVAGDPAEHESSRTEWLMEEIDAAHVGHSHKSLTLDTYAHVLIDD
jgi:hypothetical protein